MGATEALANRARPCHPRPERTACAAPMPPAWRSYRACPVSPRIFVLADPLVSCHPLLRTYAEPQVPPGAVVVAAHLGVVEPGLPVQLHLVLRQEAGLCGLGKLIVPQLL